MFRTTHFSLALAVLIATVQSGCVWNPWAASGPSGEAGLPIAAIGNPMFVPIADRELLYQQVVDEIDDYFRIEREQRIRLEGGVLTEGRVDTFPLVGATLLEPFRGDSTPGYERLHATLQSIRRRATVRMLPVDGGYLVDVQVAKELEDLLQPENATIGDATPRHDTSLERVDDQQQRLPPGTLGWIPLGRDVTLEQKILSNLQGRLNIQPQPVRLPEVQ